MTILLMLVPISLVLLGIAIGAFWWAVRSGQFDDLQTPGIAILADERRGAPADASAPPVGAASAATPASPPRAAATALDGGSGSSRGRDTHHPARPDAD